MAEVCYAECTFTAIILSEAEGDCAPLSFLAKTIIACPVSEAVRPLATI